MGGQAHHWSSGQCRRRRRGEGETSSCGERAVFDHPSDNAYPSLQVDFAPTTLMYTSWMLGICSAEDFEYGVASLLACFWVYQHMGDVMLKERAAKREAGTYVENGVYSKWIDMYGGEEFEAEVKEYCGIAEQCANKVDDKGKERMKEIFVRGCLLEYMFWDSSLNLSAFPTFE